MKTTQNSKVLFTAQAAMIAAIYVVLTVIGASFAFGPVQVRLSEALTILPVFTPAAVPGVFLGCLISNVIAGALLPDIIFGSLATLIGASLHGCSGITADIWRRFRLLPPML